MKDYSSHRIIYKNWIIQTHLDYGGKYLKFMYWYIKEGHAIFEPDHRPDNYLLLENAIKFYYEIGDYADLTMQDIVDKYLDGQTQTDILQKTKSGRAI